MYDETQPVAIETIFCFTKIDKISDVIKNICELDFPKLKFIFCYEKFVVHAMDAAIARIAPKAYFWADVKEFPRTNFLQK